MQVSRKDCTSFVGESLGVSLGVGLKPRCEAAPPNGGFLEFETGG